MKAVTTLAIVSLVLLSGCDVLGIGGDDEKDSNVLFRVMLLENTIDSHHAPVGIFHSNTVTLSVPESFGRIVISSDEDGETPFGVDDYLQILATNSSGLVHSFKMHENDAVGGPIGEQFVMSNVVTFTQGDYTVQADWYNKYAPPGGNASASPAWIVVLKN